MNLDDRIRDALRSSVRPVDTGEAYQAVQDRLRPRVREQKASRVLALGVALVLAALVGLPLYRAFREPPLVTGDSAGSSVTPSPGELSPELLKGKVLVMARDALVEDRRSGEGTKTVRGDITEFRDAVLVYEQTATDERLSGRQVTQFNADINREGVSRLWGTTELSNAHGSWKGYWYGAVGGDSVYAKLVLKGSGGYEGLEAHMQMHIIGTDGTFGARERGWTGWIQKAD